MVRKILFTSILLLVFLVVGGCNDNSVKQIKADYFDISFGQNLYEGFNKVDKETVDSLVKAYNQIEVSGKTDQPINYEKAITITFIHNDQISGSLVLDDKGVFHLSDSAGNCQIEPNKDIYEKAFEIYNDLKKQY